MSLMPPTITRDLSLERHGYRVHPMGPYYQAFPDGGSLTIFEDDPARTHAELKRFSPKDATAWGEWNTWLEGLADVMAPLLLQVPPDLGSRHPRDLADLARLAWRNRGVDSRTIADITRLMTMSIADLLDDWFESPEIKGALAVNGVIGTWAGPYEPGTAYVMAHHSIGDVGDGQLGSWGYPEGGMGAVSDAIRSAAEEFGAEIRTSTAVERVLVRDGRAAGVVLAGGQEDHAPVVVTSVHPRLAFLEHLDRNDLPPEFVTDIERWKTRSGVVKINLALDRLPDFAATPNSDAPTVNGVPEHLTGSVEMAPTMEFIERAFIDAREGRPAAAPFSDTVIPTTLDRTLNPDGTHVFSMFSQWVPASWATEPHQAELEAYCDRLVALYDELAPGFTDSIIARDIVGPHEMETEYSLVGGNIFHGELSVEQLFHLRPAPGYADYRTPVTGLYNASSATHAGGGVCGIPGLQAARAAIKDTDRGSRNPVARLKDRLRRA
jgi:phytoene dehydrogenase-like protein